MKIDLTEPLAEIETIEFDGYPDQKAEYKAQRAVQLSLEAIRSIIDQLSDNGVAEEDALEFAVAMKILERHQGRLQADVMRQRFAGRSRG